MQSRAAITHARRFQIVRTICGKMVDCHHASTRACTGLLAHWYMGFAATAVAIRVLA